MKRITIVTVFSILLSSGSIIYAQYGLRDFSPVYRPFNIPSLTEEQREKIRELRTSHLQEIQPLRNEMKELRAQYQTLSEVPNPDMTAINKNIDAQTNLMNKIMKLNASHKQAIRKNLTDEQKLIFDRIPGNANRPYFHGERRMCPTQMPGYRFQRPGRFNPCPR